MRTEPSQTVHESAEYTWGTPRKVTFYAIVVILLVGLNVAFWRVHLFPFLAWLPDNFLNDFYASGQDFEGPFAPHRIHMLAIAANHWALMIGLILQFKNPIDKVAPMWQATGVILLSAATWPFNDVSRIPPPVFAVLVLAVVAGLLHPSGILRLRPHVGRKAMAALWGLAAIPAIFLLISQMRLQMTGMPADPHWQGLHYNFMAEYALVLILVLGLGASTLPGWRYSVWTGGFLLGLLGAGFVAYPDQASSQGVAWGLAMIGLAAAWIVLGERRHVEVPSSEREPVASPSRGER
jgi:hypothetical protein